MVSNHHSICSYVIFYWVRIIWTHRRSSILSSLGRNYTTIRNSYKTKKKIMNAVMYITGSVIFLTYLGLLTWSIRYGSRRQEETNNYANLHDRIDTDGMGNFSRFPIKKIDVKVRRRKKARRIKQSS